MLRSLTVDSIPILRSLRLPGPADEPRRRQLGQVLPLFVLLAVVLLSGSALVTDVALWWANEQRAQRAADAAALAGAAYLPGNERQAFTAARQEAAKNGFVSGGNVSVVPRRDPEDVYRLLVDIDDVVQTNFARVFCWDGGPCLEEVRVGVTGAAMMVQKVPMGSPQNYYGVGRLVDAVQTPRSTPHPGDTTGRGPTTWASGTWNNPGGAYGTGDAWTRTNGATHVWRGFDFSSLPDPLTITSIRVRLQNAEISGTSSSGTDCRIRVRVSWDGTNWSSPIQSSRLTSIDDTFYFPSGSTSAGWLPLSAWEPPAHGWTRTELAGGMHVELTRVSTGVGCPTDREVRFDDLDVEVRYDWTETTMITEVREVDVRDPYDNGVLAPQNFWGALQSQGAPNIQGDAYMTYYDTRKGILNKDDPLDDPRPSVFKPASYYWYGVEFPPGSSNGEIWLFDPGFCHVGSGRGTGESYTLDGANGSSAFNAVSTYYELWADYDHTPLKTGDDTLLYDSGDDFANLRYWDSDLSTTTDSRIRSAGLCNDLPWHNNWVKVASGINNNGVDDDVPLVVRLHTYSTPKIYWEDPSSTNQLDATALNAFAIWGTASHPGGKGPRVYGLGAMETYFPLPTGKVSEFYLAQVDAKHDGKKLEIRLWDPGDTGSLSATLQILAPGQSDYVPVDFDWSAERNSSSSGYSNCDGRKGSGDSVTTNTGGGNNSSLFNGCWLTITLPIVDADDPMLPYSAPHPASDTVTNDGGWWKIRYNMGPGANPATDLTTWEVSVKGNPVHLVPVG